MRRTAFFRSASSSPSASGRSARRLGDTSYMGLHPGWSAAAYIDEREPARLLSEKLATPSGTARTDTREHVCQSCDTGESFRSVAAGSTGGGCEPVPNPLH